MARKWGWFSAVKKVIGPDSKKDQKNHKLKATWLAEPAELKKPALSIKEAAFEVAPPLPSLITEQENNEKSKQAYSVDVEADDADIITDAPAPAPPEGVHLPSEPHNLGKPKEEIAAIKIQTAFRSYLARRAMHALRGLVRLKTLIQGDSVKQQAATTLRCMQTLAKAQSQIRERRIRMSEENHSRHRQLLPKHEKELNKLQATVGEEWDDSMKSKEQIEARLLDRKEAAVRRERARAYAVSNQQTWRNPSKSVKSIKSMVNNPEWGWSWLDQWMALRPWDHNDLASSRKSGPSRAISVREISRSHSLGDRRLGRKPSPAGQKSSRPPTPYSPSLSSASGKARPPPVIPKGNYIGSDSDESRSTFSSRPQHHRRHSIGGSLVRDNDSLTSSPSTPSNKTPTKSAVRSKYSPASKVSAISAKKSLSFPSSSTGSKRHSCPPQMETFFEKDAAPITGQESEATEVACM